MKYSRIFKALFVVTTVVLTTQSAFADRPARDVIGETVPVKESPSAIPQPIPAATGCFSRLSLGQTVWFFSEEDTETAPGAYFDFWCADVPLNYRIGIEGRHMDVSQKGTEDYAEFPGKTVEITYIRIPLAVEYYHDLGEGFTWFVGGGPDLLRTANDISEFDVGAHLASRISYSFDENWGVALEGGYMWNRLDGRSRDLDLDGAYITPTVHYTF